MPGDSPQFEGKRMATEPHDRKDRSKLTPEVQQRIVEVIRAGNYVSVAARFAGIGRRTFYKWMARGEREESGPYRDFYVAVRQAEAFAEVRAVAILQSEMKDNWRAALGYLERKFPTRWATGNRRRPFVSASKQSTEASDDRDLYRKITYYETVFDRLATQEPGTSPPMQATGSSAGGDGIGEPVDST